jgi:uncharacterized protein (DUF488 family)
MINYIIKGKIQMKKLTHKFNILVSLIQEVAINYCDLNNLVFMLAYKYLNDSSLYQFININNQPYSMSLHHDLDYLIKKELISNNHGILVSLSSNRYAKGLNMIEKFALAKFKNNYYHNKELFLTQSNQLFQDTCIKKQNPINEATLFTIGYEGLSLEQYLNKLLNNQVKMLCDVRKNAFSQKYGFSKFELQDALNKVNILYLHIPELGILKANRNNDLFLIGEGAQRTQKYVSTRIHEKNKDSILIRQEYISSGDRKDSMDQDNYNLLKSYEVNILPQKDKQISILMQNVKKYQHVAITCFEANVHHCHRGKIAKYLKENPLVDFAIKHL